MQQGGENSVETGFGLHNATGNAEHIVATMEYGSEKSNQFSLSYEHPRICGLPLTVRCPVFDMLVFDALPHVH